jgi:hypothetical protein
MMLVGNLPLNFLVPIVECYKTTNFSESFFFIQVKLSKYDIKTFILAYRVEIAQRSICHNTF